MDILTLTEKLLYPAILAWFVALATYLFNRPTRELEKQKHSDGQHNIEQEHNQKALDSERIENARLRSELTEDRKQIKEQDKCITGYRILAARHAFEISMYRDERQSAAIDLGLIADQLEGIPGLKALAIDIRQMGEQLKTDIVVPELELD